MNDHTRLRQAFVERYNKLGNAWSRKEFEQDLDTLLDGERERCAKIAENHPTAAMMRMSTGESVAAVIRRTL